MRAGDASTPACSTERVPWQQTRHTGPLVVAQNRKARHDYFIEETFEAGLVLTGTEVKSLRAGRASIAESYAAERDGELYLVNAHIPEYKPARASTTSPAGRASCCCIAASSTSCSAPSSATA